MSVNTEELLEMVVQTSIHFVNLFLNVLSNKLTKRKKIFVRHQGNPVKL